MKKQQLIIPFLLILVIFVMSSPEIIFAEKHDPETTCGSGTELVNGICQIITGQESKDKPVDYLSPDSMLIYGILIAALATIVGIFVTIVDRKSAAQTRLQEIIKLYSDEIREITNQESSLDTKQACSLYAEQYLDTLEQIATLKEQNVFKDEAIDYFNNNFAYGMDLWWWHHKHIHHLDDTMQNRLWKISNNTEIEGTQFDDIFPKEIDPDSEPMKPKYMWKNDKGEKFTEVEIQANRDALNHSSILEDVYTEAEMQSMEPAEILAKRKALLSFLKDDRWPLFRKLCLIKSITPFDNEYDAFDGLSADYWRTLPDSLYYDYDTIPDENGLSKAELVQVIRPFANDLSQFVEKEKDMETPEEFEVYAEQYLETLEQIATLYKNKIIPHTTKEYFENKFSYGCNLWDWYHQRTLKFSQNLREAFWKTDAPKIKLEDIYSKEQLAVMTQAEKDTRIGEFGAVKDNTYRTFLTHYSNGNKTIAIDNLIREDPDVWKLVKLAVNAGIEKYDVDSPNTPNYFNDMTINKIKDFIAGVEDYLAPHKLRIHDSAENLIRLRKNVGSTISQIQTATNNLKNAEKELEEALENLPRSSDEHEYKAIHFLFKEFVYNFALDERWKDFRWWCKKQGITHFQEDPSEGLILPLKMWQAQYR